MNLPFFGFLYRFGGFAFVDVQLYANANAISGSRVQCYKGRMVLGGSGKVSFGRRIREDPLISVFRVSYIYTHSEVVSSPK